MGPGAIIDSVALATLVIVALPASAFALAWYVFARWFVRPGGRSETRVDDLLARYLRPEHVAWLAPLLVVSVRACFLSNKRGLAASGTGGAADDLGCGVILRIRRVAPHHVTQLAGLGTRMAGGSSLAEHQRSKRGSANFQDAGRSRRAGRTPEIPHPGWPWP